LIAADAHGTDQSVACFARSYANRPHRARSIGRRVTFSLGRHRFADIFGDRQTGIAQNGNPRRQDLCPRTALTGPFLYSQAWDERRGACLLEIVGEDGGSGWGEAFGTAPHEHPLPDRGSGCTYTGRTGLPRTTMTRNVSAKPPVSSNRLSLACRKLTGRVRLGT
jgi:hypothetical protein